MFELLFSLWLSTQGAYESEIDVNALPSSSIEKVITEDAQIDGKSGLVYDLHSGVSLWGSSPDKRLSVASLTKLMTALIIIENHSLDEKVEVSYNAMYADGAKVYLNKGEIYSVKEMLQGMLIRSGNDTAIALAEFHSGTEDFFVREMNARAMELGLKNTHYANSTGLDAQDHYSSARDLALLTTMLLKNDFVKETVSKKMGTIYSSLGRKVSFYSTNHLLGGSIRGVKTGTTEDAGECLITLIERDGKDLLFVLLGSTNRFDTTEDLINFVFDKI